jgi:hypothetical protein
MAASIASVEAVGSPAVAAALALMGIPSAEAFGEPVVGLPGITGAGGIPSGVRFGVPLVGQSLLIAKQYSISSESSPSPGGIMVGNGSLDREFVEMTATPAQGPIVAEGEDPRVTVRPGEPSWYTVG